MRDGAFDLQPRSSRPATDFHAALALVLSATGIGIWLILLASGTTPVEQLGAAFLTAAPTFALVASIVFVSRARVMHEDGLSWAAAGTLVATVAIVLQFLSHGAIWPSGGPLGTSADASAVLYLIFHAALFAAALCHVAGAGVRWLRPFVVSGVVLSALVALDALPLPSMVGPGARFSGLASDLTWVVAALGAAATALWLRRHGTRMSSMAGWYGVALFVATTGTALGAASGARFDALWWSSLSMRVAAFAVLALGGVLHVVHELARVESYAEAELSRREAELREASAAATLLMHNADRLSRTATPEHVGRALCSSFCEITGGDHALLLVQDSSGRLEIVQAQGYDAEALRILERTVNDPRSPEQHVLVTGRSVFITSPEDLAAVYPPSREVLPHDPLGRLALVPLIWHGEVIAVLGGSEREPRPWSEQEKALMEALAAQGGPALARAREAERPQTVRLDPVAPRTPS